MQSRPIQFLLRADSPPPVRAPRRRRFVAGSVTSLDHRPSLAIALARAFAITLFVALAVLAQVARAQSAPRTVSPASTSPSTSAPAEPGIAAALRRSADAHGLWGSVGVGRGTAGLDCDVCARETTRAYSLQGTIGVRLSSTFLVGAETFAWLDVIGGGVDRIARGTYLIARSYPFGASPLFLHGGLGVASFQVNDGEVAFKTRSPSLSLAAGYDWKLGGLTVTPTLTAITSTGGRLNSDRTGNAITDNARLGLLRSAVAFSWFR